MNNFLKDKNLIETRALQIKTQKSSEHPDHPMVTSNLFAYYCVQQAIKQLSREREIQSMFERGSYADVFMRMVITTQIPILFIEHSDLF